MSQIVSPFYMSKTVICLGLRLRRRSLAHDYLNPYNELERLLERKEKKKLNHSLVLLVLLAYPIKSPDRYIYTYAYIINIHTYFVNRIFVS